MLAAGELRATFVPGAGMIGCSLRHRGEELLVQRGGLDAWRGTGKSFGLPLLHPWANRLRDWRYAVAGRAVEIDRERGVVRADEQRPADPRRARRGRGLGRDGRGRRRRRRVARRRRSTTGGATTGSPCSRSRTALALDAAHRRRRARPSRRRSRPTGGRRCRSRSAGIRGSRCPACRARSGSSRSPSARPSPLDDARAADRRASRRPRPSAAPLGDRVLDDHSTRGGGRALRARRRRPGDRGRVGRRLPLRAGLRARRRSTSSASSR